MLMEGLATMTAGPGNGSLATFFIQPRGTGAVNDFSQERDVFLDSLDNGNAMFADTLAFIERWYIHTPTDFRNGPVHNSSGQNQGSCKVLALATLLGFDREQTLLCFGEHYRAVVASPDGEDHANLRRLLRDGPVDIEFERFPLTFREQS